MPLLTTVIAVMSSPPRFLAVLFTPGQMVYGLFLLAVVTGMLGTFFAVRAGRVRPVDVAATIIGGPWLLVGMLMTAEAQPAIYLVVAVSLAVLGARGALVLVDHRLAAPRSGEQGQVTA